MEVFKYMIALIFLLASCSSFDDSNDGDFDPCEEMLDMFAYVTGNFTHCAIHNARPIRMCSECVSSYINVRDIYDDILKLGRDIEEKCKTKLINLDRLQIVNSGFEYVTSLWGRASCDSCFHLNGSSPTFLKKDVKDLFNVSDSFENCLKDHNSSSVTLYEPSVCKDCSSLYKDLNGIYESLRGPSGENPICMDVVDLLNLTRIEWSSELKCYFPHRQTQIVYWSVTGVALIIPILFYLGAWRFITRKEQIINAQINFPGYLRHYSYHSQPSVTPARR